MEMSSAKWLSEMEIMEDPSCSLFHQYEVNTFDYSIDDLHFQSFSPQSYSSYNPNLHPITSPTPTLPSNIIETCSTRPLKQLKTNSSCTTQPQHMTPNNKASPPSYSSHLISFGDSDSLSATYVDGQDCSNLKPPKVEDGSIGTTNFPSMMMHQASNKRYVGGSTRTPLHAQEHVIAERKRRERLSQRFIALSAVVPGLKKTDKASVLGDTIKYLKQLQERVRTLEEQTAKTTVESVVFVKKSQLISSDDETSSCGDESFTSQSTQPLPEIEARVSDKDVLIKIHCEKQKGCTVKILNEVEKLHLTVNNSTVLPFGKSIFDITIVAKTEEGMCMTARDLARNLRAALLKLM